MRERSFRPLSGWLGLLLLLGLGSFAIMLVFGAFGPSGPAVGRLVAGIGVGVLTLFCLGGFFIIDPNDSRVLLFFGSYSGTVKTNGFFWMVPLYARSRVSLKVVSFESAHLKVNELEGNPIEIGAIVVWRVVDTYAASFHVDDYAQFVRMQAETALRDVATRYPYDDHGVQGRVSLRGQTNEVAEVLKEDLQRRCALAGVGILDARMSHLAYAPEIAHAMLQRQQAGAVIAARQLIVEGAVGMVEMAIQQLSAKKVVELDEARKAAMVANLLVVLCGERGTQPVVNTTSVV